MGIKHLAVKTSRQKGYASEWNANHIIDDNVDFNHYQAQNLIIQTGSAFPAGPVAGQMFYRSDRKVLYCWNGTNWVINLDQGTAFPITPLEGQMFYRIDLHGLYYWNGTIWVAGGVPATSVTNEVLTTRTAKAVGTSTNYARQDHTHGDAYIVVRDYENINFSGTSQFFSDCNCIEVLINARCLSGTANLLMDIQRINGSHGYLYNWQRHRVRSGAETNDWQLNQTRLFLGKLGSAASTMIRVLIWRAPNIDGFVHFQVFAQEADTAIYECFGSAQCDLESVINKLDIDSDAGNIAASILIRNIYPT